MAGFETDDRDLPSPPVAVSDDVRDRLVSTLYAIVDGATPEDIAGYLETGFPPAIAQALERPGETDEMRDHVNVLLYVMQTPVGGTSEG